MTEQEVINKVNEYKSLITTFETDRDNKISQRDSYSVDSEEYENLSNEIVVLEGKITATKMVIGL